jgi:hypothetical protein
LFGGEEEDLSDDPKSEEEKVDIYSTRFITNSYSLNFLMKKKKKQNQL